MKLKSKCRDIILAIWVVGFVVSAIAQIVLPEWVAAGTTWGFSPSWQQEIGFWNVAMAVLLALVLCKGNEEIKRLVCLGLVVLSVLLGGHHGVALLQGGYNYTNGLGFALNLTGFLLALRGLQSRG